jgi:hypothetical protein
MNALLPEFHISLAGMFAGDLFINSCLAYFRGWSSAGINEEELQVKDHGKTDCFEVAM